MLSDVMIRAQARMPAQPRGARIPLVALHELYRYTCTAQGRSSRDARRTWTRCALEPAEPRLYLYEEAQGLARAGSPGTEEKLSSRRRKTLEQGSPLPSRSVLLPFLERLLRGLGRKA